MKQPFRLLALAFGLSVSTLTSHAALVLGYQFNGDLNDISANSNNGTFVGSSLTTDRFGNANSALAVTPNAGVVSQNNIGITGNTSRTISLWVNLSTMPPWPTGNLVGWGSSSSYYNASVIQLCYHVNYLGALSNITFDGGYAGASVLTDPVSLADAWHMLTLTYNPTDGFMSFYLDGVKQVNQYTDLNLGLIDTHDGLFRVGASLDFVDRGVTGLIDDVFIFNEALSSSEVSDMYISQSTASAIPEPTSTLSTMALIVSGLMIRGRNKTLIKPKRTNK